MVNQTFIAEQITHLGTVGLVAPIALLMAIWLALRSGRADAIRWSLCVLATGLLISLLKIWLIGCRLSPLDVISPSGHVGATAVVYGGALTIVLGPARQRWLWLALPLYLLWVVAMAWSRVQLHAHSLSEVCVGGIIGVTAAAIFAVGYQGTQRPRLILIVVAGVLTVLFANLRPTQLIQLEPELRKMALMLRHDAAWVCPAPPASQPSPWRRRHKPESQG